MKLRIALEDVSFGFGGKPVFTALSLDIGSENPLAILGPSGCGKTTLLKLLAGLLTPDSGRVRRTGPSAADGKDRSGTAPSAFVFQEPRLLPWLTVLENVSLPIRRLAGPGARRRARHFLELVSLGGRLDAYPGELSGGQRQRVSIARAFAYPAPAVFMDEPFQSLDIPLRIELMEIILGLLEREPRLLVAVTHDPREAVRLGRRILILGHYPEGIVFDETSAPGAEERARGTPDHSLLEGKLLKALTDAAAGRLFSGGGQDYPA
ncbi:MAG: ABC transporter ATP-binding protein [Treponema sp.]|jgi:NitT/TauT family transport system ATP-binding protein|nr:ABC transporter ATP-binding protein [Treponema sp.]